MRPELEVISYDHTESSIRCFRGESKHFDFNWHYHPEYEITCILAGSGCRMIGSHTGEYEKFDLALIGSDLPHTWYNPSPLKTGKLQAAIVIHLEDRVLDLLFGFREMSRIKSMFKSAGTGLLFDCDTGKTAAGLMEEISVTDGPVRVGLLIDLLDLMAGSRYTSLDVNRGYRLMQDDKTSARLSRVHEFIRKNYTGDITLGMAAERAHMNAAAFSRFFSSVMGKTFTGFINEVRIHHACQLLLTTDLPVAAAAIDSGFKTLSHFNRKFMEIKYLTPAQYRKKYRPRS